MYRKLLFCDRL